MGLFKLIKEKRKQKKNHIISKEIVNLDMKPDSSPYEKNYLPTLTQVEIDDIHARGKITPAEMLEEWEDMDLCAPGDAIGSAAWRCRKYHHNCHDCLVDYASQQREYTSFFDVMKTVNPYKIDSIEDTPKVKKMTNNK